ncbi:MAG: NAD(P)H-hydrate dehydratase [Zetaproteobacteria bacterium]|nr:MAG: NAD(P)H-hydrate dehydratase [Zetaproteobacteria bacterium]
MSRYILSTEQMQWADRQAMQTIPSHELMARAGRAVAEAVLDSREDAGRVVIVTGPGNNGGDGFAAACHLRRRGLLVTVVSLVAGARLKGDARSWYERALAEGVKVRESATSLVELKRWLARATLVVDSIFGTGLARPLSGHFADAVACINASDRKVLAVDMPSGIDSDTGAVLGAAVRADVTLPIAAHKWGHWLGEGRAHVGRMLPVADIGIDAKILKASFAARAVGARLAQLIARTVLLRCWSKRPPDAHKGMFGHVWIFGGSVGFSGAPVLAGKGAFAGGAGLVSLVCPDTVWPIVASTLPEVMVHPQSTDAWRQARIDVIVAGPGWGGGQQALLRDLLARDESLVLDADALNMMATSSELQATLRARSAPTVLTPHPGEAARLLACDVATVQRDRPQAAIALAERFACWVVLKGAGTLVAADDGCVWLSPFGSPKMAVAGSGDVLAGLIGASLARSGEVAIADRLGAAVALHGLAGEKDDWWLAGGLAERVARMRRRIEQAGRMDMFCTNC